MKIIKYILVSLLTIIVTSSIAFSSDILKTPPTVVGDNFGFTEGPVWVNHKQIWLFTDIPMNKIYSLDSSGNVNVWMDNSGYANGLNIDQDNNIWIAHHCRRVSHTTPSGENNIVASTYNCKKLNSIEDFSLELNTPLNLGFAGPIFNNNSVINSINVIGLSENCEINYTLENDIIWLNSFISGSEDSCYNGY